MKKNKYKFLNIKGAVLDNSQLELYMEKTATAHDVCTTSTTFTYPINRLKENYNYIRKTYELLNEYIKIGIDIHPAGEWLLDNFYIIEETVKTIINNINIKKYKSFPGIASGVYNGYSRLYVLASEIVAYTDNKITYEKLKLSLMSYQKRKTLSMSEIWNMWIFLEIAIIENIRNICEKIFSSQLQKYKAESIIERVIEGKNLTSQRFKLNDKIYKQNITYKDMKYPFIEYLSYRLKMYGKKAIPYLEILEEQVKKMGMTLSEVIEKEHYDIAISKVSIGNCITSIKEILRIDFLSLFEQINGVEDILKKDPANVYSKMDYKTKECYRNKIKEISNYTKISEIYIANKALELSQKAESYKKTHIGYYLISNGYNQLIEELNFKSKAKNNKNKVNNYINTIWILTFVLLILFISCFKKAINNTGLLIILAIIITVPISEIVIQTINYILSKNVKPKLLPKLDFSKGIPKECKTFVVIPTMLRDTKKVKELFKKLEIYYLANKSSNIYFALLGDCTTSEQENEKIDEEIIKIGVEEVNILNTKYYSEEDEIPKFSFIYRKRKWNKNEEKFMGWERKRGMLCEFNNFLINGENHFKICTLSNVKSNILSQIKYIITLDSDTNLVLESGLELVGAMEHILNTPIISNNIVIDGYGIIQPRIGVDIVSSRKSMFTQIYAGSRRSRFIS